MKKILEMNYKYNRIDNEFSSCVYDGFCCNTKKTNITIFDVVVFMLGVFSTMPIISIRIASVDITVARLFLFLSILFLSANTVRRGEIVIRPNSKRICLWLGWSCISCLLGFLVFSLMEHSVFAKAAISSLPKVVILFVFSVLWGNGASHDIAKANRIMIKGLMVGCIANVVWSIIDAIGYYLLQVSFNNILFLDQLQQAGITDSMPSLVLGSGLLRSGGFNYDPAHLGFIVPVVFCYGICKRNVLYVVLALGGLLASASTTALVCSGLVFLMVFSRKIKIRDRIPLKKIIPLIVLLLILVVLITKYWNQLNDIAKRASSLFAQRVYGTYINSSDTNPRMVYIRYFFHAVFHESPFILFGTGFNTASFGYAMSAVSNVEYAAYDMEMSYICYLFDTGIVGFVLFVNCLRPLYVYYRKSKDVLSTSNIQFIFCLIAGMITCLFFYHYILFLPQILAMIVGLSIMDDIVPV